MAEFADEKTMELISKKSQAQYFNPVYQRDFPDPYILKYCGQYWAYCTGIEADGRCFGVLHSTDLVEWTYLGGALEALPGDHPCYWAPEVSYYNGQFYMYYSVGNEEFMQIRVAVAAQPGGPFVDSGRTLTQQQFAIDAHVFTDEDGQRYLFYATDFLEHSHIGTGTVVDRLLDPFTPEGQPRPVVRARYAWQVYDPQRVSKGGVRWHTVEGPFILKHKGRYYEMFSGGNWQNLTYGVSYALSETLTNPDEWRQVADGTTVLPILRTLPGQVIGPGHNSVVRGPDNRQLYCVYHCWSADGTSRTLAIDPQDWVGERMLILGPSTTPQPAPNRPAVVGFGAATWQTLAGSWQVNATGTQAHLAAADSPEALVRLPVAQPNFLLEINLRAADGNAPYGLTLFGENTLRLTWRLDLLEKVSEFYLAENTLLARLDLPPHFDPTVYHRLSLEVNHNQVIFRVDENKAQVLKLAFTIQAVGLFSRQTQLDCAGFALTSGWEDLFYPANELTPESLGWQNSSSWQINNSELLSPLDLTKSVISKGAPLANYELVVNARLVAEAARLGYGIYPCWRSTAQPGVFLQLVRAEKAWQLWADTRPLADLPPAFDPTVYQQFRFRKIADRLEVAWESLTLGELTVSDEAASIALQNGDSQIAFEMVRVTELAQS